MLSFNLSQADANSVNIERKRHPHHLIRDSMYVLHLLHLGYQRGDCAHIVGFHANSVTNFIKMYRDGGLDAVRKLTYSHAKHELRSVYNQVEQVLGPANFRTVEEARELFGTHLSYHRSHEAARQLLHRLGFKRRKVGTFPGRPAKFEEWQAQQEAFIAKLDVLIGQA